MTLIQRKVDPNTMTIIESRGMVTISEMTESSETASMEGHEDKPEDLHLDEDEGDFTMVSSRKPYDHTHVCWTISYFRGASDDMVVSTDGSSINT